MSTRYPVNDFYVWQTLKQCCFLKHNAKILLPVPHCFTTGLYLCYLSHSHTEAVLGKSVFCVLGKSAFCNKFGMPTMSEEEKRQMHIAWTNTAGVIAAAIMCNYTLPIPKTETFRHTCTVYLQTPRVFHSLMVLSRDAETI